MLVRLLVLIVLSAVASIGVFFAGQTSYDEYRFASEETRTSLEVTEAQSAELRSAATNSDAIAYSIMGGVFAAIFGSVINPMATNGKRVVGGVVGLISGTMGGAAAGYLGHWYEVTYLYPNDPVLYWVGC